MKNAVLVASFSAFLSASAPTQAQGIMTYGDIEKGDRLIWRDNKISILANPTAQTQANYFEILCPTHESRRATAAQGALVTLFHHDRTQIETSLRLNRLASPSLQGRHDSTQNIGFIGTNNTLIPTYNLGEEIEQQKKMLQSGGSITGSRPDQEELIRKLRVQAQNFCFERL